MIEINLLPSRDLLSQKEKKLRYQMFLAAAGLSIVVFASFGVSWFLGAIGQSRVAALEKETTDLMARFDSDTPKLSKLLALKDKASGIKRVLTVRPDLSLVITKLNAFNVDGVAITKLSVGTEGGLNFEVSIRDDKAFVAYLTMLESSNARAFFKHLTIPHFSLAPSGNFTLSIDAAFDKSQLFPDR